jgi:hypothetical protein
MLWLLLKRVLNMKRKLAIMVFELVEEAAEEKNDVIRKQLAEWFREDNVSMPWIKELKSITVKEEQ